MAYTPTTWKSGDVVTSAKLNKLENGVANASTLIVTIEDGEESGYVADATYAEIGAAIDAGGIVIANYYSVMMLVATVGKPGDTRYYQASGSMVEEGEMPAFRFLFNASGEIVGTVESYTLTSA